MEKFVLVGCEESQAVTIELRQKGINAFSCDARINKTKTKLMIPRIIQFLQDYPKPCKISWDMLEDEVLNNANARSFIAKHPLDLIGPSAADKALENLSRYLKCTITKNSDGTYLIEEK